MIKEQSPIGDIKLAYGVDDNPSLSKKFIFGDRKSTRLNSSHSH